MAAGAGDCSAECASVDVDVGLFETDSVDADGGERSALGSSVRA